jgi:2-phospho-L-lactate guanylyltransferase
VSAVVVGIPVKPFPAAKRRLSAVLDETARAVLGRRLAERTVGAVAASGARPLVLSADDAVTGWARSIGVDVLVDEGSSLDEAAASAVGEIRDRRASWAIVHADLPVLTWRDLTAAVDWLVAGGAVLAPSSDGGTPLIGSSLDTFEFSYGPGSFHRHLARLALHRPHVVFRRGLALDLDTPDDLAAASGSDEGAWLSG